MRWHRSRTKWKTLKYFFSLCLTAVLTSLISWSAHSTLDIDPIMSACIVVTVVYFLFPGLSLIAYAGAFAGLPSQQLLPFAWTAALCGLFVFIFFVIFEHFKLFVGKGGRLGTITLLSIATLTPIMIFRVTDYPEIFWHPERFFTIDWIQGPGAVFMTWLGAVGCIYLRRNFPLTQHAVPASLVVSLGGSFILMQIPYEYNSNLISFLFTGAYVGMSSFEVLPGYLDFGICGIISGLFGLATLGFTSGEEAGKAGFNSLCSIMIYLKLLVPLGGYLHPMLNDSWKR